MNYAPFTVQNPGTPPENIRAAAASGSDDVERDGPHPPPSAPVLRPRRSVHVRPRAAPDAGDEGTRHVRRRLQGPQRHLQQGLQPGRLEGRPGLRPEERDRPSCMEEYGNNNFGRSALAGPPPGRSGRLRGRNQPGRLGHAQPELRRPVAPASCRRSTRRWARWSRTWSIAACGRTRSLVWMGEFGRTPRINQNAGRDHWAACWSVVVGGGAMRGGQAYGSTDADGMAVADNPVTRRRPVRHDLPRPGHRPAPPRSATPSAARSPSPAATAVRSKRSFKICSWPQAARLSLTSEPLVFTASRVSLRR